MGLHVEPQSLFVLSLQIITKLLIDTFAKVCKQTKIQYSNNLARFSHKKGGILCKKLPTAIANALAYKFLQELDLRKDLVQFTNVLKEIIHIFLPSGISELRIDWHWIYIGEILLNGDTCLKGIKLLKVSRRNYRYVTDSYDVTQINKRLFNNKIIDLCELSLHDICSDEILAIVCKTCKNLQALDVTGSTQVTSKISDTIIKLKNLEKLIIKHTYIFDEGLILERLLARKKIYKLNSFGCTLISERILLALAQFPNLNSLSMTSNMIGYISAKYFTVSESRDIFHDDGGTLIDEISLRNLKTLEISQSRLLSYPIGFIKWFGNLLLNLKIEVCGVDISHVAKRCPLLTSLYLRTNCIEKNFYSTVSEFPSLRNLTLVMASEYSPTPLLSMCNNLRSLQLCANVSEYKDIQNEIFQRDVLKDLEVLCIASNDESIPMEVVKNFELHCTKLRSIKVFGENYLELSEMFRSYQGVEVSSELCLKVADELSRTRPMMPPKLYLTISRNPDPGATSLSAVISWVPEENDHSFPQQAQQDDHSVPQQAQQDDHSVPQQDDHSVPQQDDHSVPQQAQQDDHSVPQQDDHSVTQQDDHSFPQPDPRGQRHRFSGLCCIVL
ncbi:uncharacterized protein [Periplaneta americana]|uniref:uncharacterized protein n=1 Tax=Periplaneta americana TaxID=6978 RepID=UPI0037E92BA6